MQFRPLVHSWRSAVRGLAPALAMLVLGGATLAPVFAQGAAQPSGNWSTGPIVPALANSPDLGMLAAFRGPVLLPPPALAPFAALPLVPPPSGLTADADSYGVLFGSAYGWHVGASHLSPRETLDAVGEGCAPGESYCDTGPTEAFRGLQVNGNRATVIHGVGPRGETNAWSIAWFDDGPSVMYSLGGNVTSAAEATKFPSGKSPGHVGAAQYLADLAGKLVVWVPDNGQDNSGVITCAPGHLLGQGEVIYVCQDGFVYDVNPFPMAPTLTKYRQQGPAASQPVATWPMPNTDEALRNPQWVDDQGRTCVLEDGAQVAHITCTTGDDAASQ